MKNFLKKSILPVVAICLSLPARAANLQDAFSTTGYLNLFGTGVGYDTNKRDVVPVIANIISVALSFLGVLFLCLMIYAGITWMTAQGDPKKATKAKDMMLASIIGLIIVIAAYAITYLVVVRFNGDLLKIQ